jgi:ERCC4-type nuclease
MGFFNEVLMSNKITSIIIDSREPAWVQNLEFGGVPKAIAPLDAGDFLIAASDNRTLGIERKTSSDFLNTLAADRLFPQLTRLREQTAFAYLLITGPLQPGADGKTITERVTGWDWNALQGALLTVQELGVSVVHAVNDEDLEPAIIRLAARRRDDVRVLPPRQPNVYGPGAAVLAALPGIGLERLDAVLEAAGTPAWALQMLTQKHGEDVPGIGPATKARIRNALGLEDELDLIMTVRPQEK